MDTVRENMSSCWLPRIRDDIGAIQEDSLRDSNLIEDNLKGDSPREGSLRGESLKEDSLATS